MAIPAISSECRRMVRDGLLNRPFQNEEVTEHADPGCLDQRCIQMMEHADDEDAAYAFLRWSSPVRPRARSAAGVGVGLQR